MKKLINFNLPIELYHYLKKVSKENYSTMTKYLIDMIVEDMKKRKIKL